MGTDNRIVLITLMLLAAIAIIGTICYYIYFYKREHFVCPSCGFKFKPKVLKMILAERAVNGRIIKCPQCGKKDYMEPRKDSNTNLQ